MNGGVCMIKLVPACTGYAAGGHDGCNVNVTLNVTHLDVCV